MVRSVPVDRKPKHDCWCIAPLVGLIINQSVYPVSHHRSYNTIYAIGRSHQWQNTTVDVLLHSLDRCSTSLQNHLSLQHASQSACRIHYAPATMDMISHQFTLSVITDGFGQTAQFYMARTDHHCESVVQPVFNHLPCMHTRCTAPMHHSIHTSLHDVDKLVFTMA